MSRPLALMASAVLLFSLSGCDFLEDLLEVEDATSEVTAGALTGKILQFTNPNPDVSIGEQSAWDYTFRSGAPVGCNAERGFTSTGLGDITPNSIQIMFGAQWERYRLDSMEGSLADGTLKGTFHLTSSAGSQNVVDGTFKQASSSRFSGCG